MEIKNIKSIVFDKDAKHPPIRMFMCNPLDVMLETMQGNMRRRCEHEADEHGDFAPIVETYTISPNYQYDVPADEVRIVCRKSDGNEKHCILETVVITLDKRTEIRCLVAEGTKKEIIEKLDDYGLFLDIKNDVLHICYACRDGKAELF